MPCKDQQQIVKFLLWQSNSNKTKLPSVLYPPFVHNGKEENPPNFVESIAHKVTA